MSSRADYTAEEWKTLLLAPVQSGVAVLLASKSGFFGTAQEMLALYHATNRSAAQQYPDNALIEALLSDTKTEESKAVREQAMTYMRDKTARESVKAEVLQTCRSAFQILLQKTTPQEASGYKNWLLDVCRQVANAASEEGQKVSPAEEARMREIAGALS